MVSIKQVSTVMAVAAIWALASPAWAQQAPVGPKQPVTQPQPVIQTPVQTPPTVPPPDPPKPANNYSQPRTFGSDNGAFFRP